MMKIGLINYGSGNFRSVFNALRYLNLDMIEVQKPPQLDQVSHIILPGVGSFKALMDNLHRLGFIAALEQHVIKCGKPYLGICVGMQILATTGTEFQQTPGLDYIKGTVVKLPVEAHGLRLPHIGWNDVVLQKTDRLLTGIADDDLSFYFLHSYHFVPDQKEALVATSPYGSEITACVALDNIYGVQFHPEKSQHNGLQLLKNFAALKS